MKNSQGQSTFEFLMVFLFSIGILSIFVQLGINMTGGYLVHYATYMASRTFLVRELGNVNSISTDYSYAAGRAKEVFDSYRVEIFGVYDPAPELRFNYYDNNPQIDYFFTGAYYRYKQPMSIFDYLGGEVDSEMYSESFLGKEPTRGECWERTKKAFEELAIRPDHEKFTTVFDNGC